MRIRNLDPKVLIGKEPTVEDELNAQDTHRLPNEDVSGQSILDWFAVTTEPIRQVACPKCRQIVLIKDANGPEKVSSYICNYCQKIFVL